MSRRWLPKIFISILYLFVQVFFALSAQAVDVVATVGDQGPVELNGFIRTYFDASKEMSFSEVRKQSFSPIQEQTTYGFDKRAAWVRFTMKSTLPTKSTFYIEEDYPLIDYIDAYMVYVVDGEEFIDRYSTGDQRSYDTRPVDLRNFVLPVTLNPYAQKTIYIRYQTNGSLNIHLRVLTERELLENVANEQLVYGLYYGGFFVLILYNFFIFLVVRERLFVLYTLFAISLAGYMTVQNGFLFQYVLPNSPGFVNKLLLILLCMSFYFSIRFSRKILDSGAEMPIYNRIGLAFEWLMATFIIALPVLNYHYMMKPIAGLTVVMSVFMICLGFRSFYLRHTSAPYYILAWGALLTGVLIFMLKSYGLIEHNVFTNNAIQIGSMVEMILLSLVLSQRVSAIKLNSSLDSLSSCFNRRYFDERMALFFNKRGITQRPLSLIVVDIDHFKRFNDRHGHVEGDRAIRLVAQTLLFSIRKPNVCCRYGGEEFVLILPGTHDQDAMKLAEKLRVRVSEIAILPEPITISAGVASCTGGSFSSPRELFNAADIALYKAKSDGRNCVINFAETGDQRRSTRVTGVEI